MMKVSVSAKSSGELLWEGGEPTGSTAAVAGGMESFCYCKMCAIACAPCFFSFDYTCAATCYCHLVLTFQVLLFGLPPSE